MSDLVVVPPRRQYGPKPKERPLCSVCGERRVKALHRKTCGSSCGALSRADKGQMRALAARARDAWRQQTVQRIRERLQQEIAPFVGRPLTEQELLALGGRIWRRAYHNGWGARGGRERCQQQRSA